MTPIKSATLALAATLFTQAYAQKPVVLISGNGNISVDARDFGAGLSKATISKQDQTMEMAQDFLQVCVSVEITLEQAATPDYFVRLNRKGSPGLLWEIGQSQIMVLNRRKSVILVAKDGTVKSAVKLRLAFLGDEVRTVAEMGWRALSNGALMNEAAPRFDVFVTLDQNLRFQNETGKQPLGIVLLITRFNHIAAYRPQFAEIRDLARKTKAGQISFVQIR